MAFVQSTHSHDRGIYSSLKPGPRADFILFPSHPLNSFVDQETNSEPVSSRLFQESGEAGSLPMDSAGPQPVKATRYSSYLPSPYSSVGDVDVVSATGPDNLVFGTGRFNAQQQGIPNNYSTGLRGRAKDIETAATFERIPYSPESLTSDYRHPTVADGNGGAPKLGSSSPSQRLSRNNAGAYPINDGSTPPTYLPTGFATEKESPSRHSPGTRVNPHRTRYHPYSPEFPRSHPENPLPPYPGGNTGYLHHRDMPRSGMGNDTDFAQNAGPPLLDHARPAAAAAVTGDSQGSDSPSSWSRTPWSPDLHHVSQYPSPYPSFSTSQHLEPSYVTAPYHAPATYIPDRLPAQRGSPPGQQQQQQNHHYHHRHSARSHGLDTFSPSTHHPPAIPCPHCTQTFPTAEQYTKHQQKHQKMYRCRFADCTRTEGFATPNDRERHEKSVHKIAGFYWRCLEPSCSSFRKEFARRDNLKDHLKRMHTMPAGVDEQEANAWRNQLADSGRYEKPDTSHGRALR